MPRRFSKQPVHCPDRKRCPLTRTALTFRLSGPAPLPDLLREFALHKGVVTHTTGSSDQPLLTVETGDTQAAIWDVRTTIGIFDDRAVEVPNQADGRSA